jgi:uncharacterized membrane protein (UPF0127 family)
VEVATTPAQQEKGMMFRDGLAPNYGMLFIYDQVQPVQMWMRNTKIPLDMLFIDANGSILNIAENAKPMDETIIPSRYPVKAVLEIGGGEVTRLGIKVGDRAEHPAFKSP